MLADIVDYLLCPVCGADLALTGRGLRCPAGHTFDVARQGYANLLPGNARPGTADTPEMVRARADFLGAGHFAPLTDLLAGRATRTLPPDARFLDAGAGTGAYLSAVLDEAPTASGLALDISKHAARRAARAHPRAGAVVADLWRPLPVRDTTVDVILNVFAPRNPAEFRRVLRPGGALHVVTPSPRHLGPLVERLGLLTVDEQKTERMDAALADHFALETRENLETRTELAHKEIETLVGMGPNAHHVTTEELSRRIGELADPFEVPLSFTLSTFRPRG
ncbi:putative RNA methyltransferase [Actinomadura hibisca]|uniref:putative RNA methyltransferase n=1 Tax=Actinomadura hibisca TaxID=68565 RepID=UPI00082F8122|nr:methyltransferase domain-containing protein [Actinomadura hibisca]